MRSPQPSCRTEIRRHIAGLPEGAIFSTKDVVQCGRRNTIDQTLWRMVRSREIERLARGLFVSSCTRKVEYSDYEIAEKKTKGFGNEIVLTGQECAQELGLITEQKSRERAETSEAPRTFLTTGCTTRFRRGDHYIHLRKASSTKTRLADDNAGKAVRALWWRKAENLDVRAIYKAIKQLNNNDYRIVMNQAAVIPSWLRDQLRTTHLTLWRRYSARKPAAYKRIAAEYYLPVKSCSEIQEPMAISASKAKTKAAETSAVRAATEKKAAVENEAVAKTAAQCHRTVRLPDLRLNPLQNSLHDSIRHWIEVLSNQSFSAISPTRETPQ